MKHSSLHIIFTALFLILFLSCNDTKDGELIPPVSIEEMGMTLLELQYAEQKSIGAFPDSLQRVTKKADRNFDSLALFYQEVFMRNNTDFESFKENLEWYKSNAKFLDEALAYAKEVLEKNKIEGEAGKQSEDKESSKKADSLIDDLNVMKSIDVEEFIEEEANLQNE